MSDPTYSRSAYDRPHGELALAITIAALLLFAIFQTIGGVRDRVGLARAHAAQQPTVDQSTKLRAQLETIAGKTAELANSGDAAARDVLDLMHQQGVAITPPKQP